MLYNVLHANGRLYPKGYIASGYNTLLSTNVITKTSISSADIGILQTISPSSIIQSATITSPNIAFGEISKNILHTKGYLYPKGYAEQRFDNIFFSKNIPSSSVVSSPTIKFHYIFYTNNLIAQTKTENPHIAFKFIAYANKLNEKTQTTIADLYTNPAYLELTDLKAQQKENANTALYPNWYKPHKNQIGTGIVFGQGERSQRTLSAVNITPNRRDRRHIEKWQKALKYNRRNRLRWIEKRSIDANVATPFSLFEAKGRRVILTNYRPHNIDHDVWLKIDELSAYMAGLLLNAGNPHAVDIKHGLLVDVLKELGIKFDLVVPISYSADRVRFIIAWGVGGLGCLHRYIPPLGNDVNFDFTTPEKAVL